MKRFLCILLLAMILISAVSCSNDKPEEPVFPTLKIDGIDVSDFCVVAPEDTDEIPYSSIVDDLVGFVKGNFNVELKKASDVAELDGKHALYIGPESLVPSSLSESAKSNEQFLLDGNHGSIYYYEGNLWIAGDNIHSVKTTVLSFKNSSTPKEGENVEISYSEPKSVKAQFSYEGELLGVMSYNVKTGQAKRYSRAVFSNITSYDPDIVGLQEFGADWIEQFILSDISDTYTYLGKQRSGSEGTIANNTTNEASPILFKTEKFNCIENGTRWLSETPEIISKYKNSNFHRIMTYAVLERKSDSKRFIVANVHPDYDKNNPAQLEILVNIVNGIKEEYGNLPTVFTGDYNCTDSGEGYKIMINSGLEDARHIAFNTTDRVTFPDVDAKNKNPRIIDFIFLSENQFYVKDFKVTVSNASDHYPIFARILFK